ncbi:MAG: host-nuclease inhibitor Gam family protein [Novosphingobium sp.]
MSGIRTPRSTKAATELLERYAELDGQVAGIEANRTRLLARANARADAAAAGLIAERALIRDKLEPWWQEAAAELTEGKRKSIELGGCVVGTQASRASLAIAGEEDDVLTLLKTLRWAKPLVRIKYSIDRVATLKALDGSHKAALAELGVSRADGKETFFVKRTAQAGTLAKV